jgi:VIT1/CCC1 family predicted Fe2+/Mn2+ transporter
MATPYASENDPHSIKRSGWLRAAVLRANDGIVLIYLLLVGVAAADTSVFGVSASRAGYCPAITSLRHGR